MNCQECVEFLMAYLEGTLPPEELRVFEEHMRRCPPCVDYLETYRRTVELGKAACRCESEEIPAEVPEGLIRAILAARPPQEPGG